MIPNILTSVLEVILYVIDKITFFLPQVTELPLGIDTALVFAVGNIKAFVGAFPFAQLPWTYFLLGLSLQFLYYLWYWADWFMSKFRG